ncbi:glyoxalase bleomycin resistance protein dioxygenase [Leptolyngbya sp. Heron Island J]|uniref:VOC family protein n=1 Tax=Leptolyngbya sp. Heron Island J TaxID=1385935 RepID=UPI0003B9B344|nr:VOC family protein [Leptolyngbya sp. Heron Island J]ESA32060.1 glyoxalase bleomycin resistance protein dioxygenase [Leptolyngbya sp. Heron Island J]
MQLSPYLSFDGCCEAAFKFYEQCLGGKIEAIMPYQGSPMEAEVPAAWASKVMHGEFRLGEFVVMGSDCMPDKYEAAKGTSLMVGIKDPVEAERAFKALAENGTVTMPIQETFWAAKFGMLVDQFGIPWMINCDQPM